MKPNSLFASLTVLGTLMLVSDLAAAQNCEENDGRRRRPGQAAIECLPTVGSPSVDSQQTKTGKAPTSNGQQDPIIRRQAQQRRTNPVSPIPRPQLRDYQASVPVPDRWRIVDSLYEERWWDPYNRNLLKGDKPLHDDWFFSFTGIWDTVYESRTVPTPVGSSSTGNGGKLDLIGDGEQQFYNQNLLMEFVYYKGNTTFKPPDLEFRFLPVVNYNRLELQEVQGVNANPNDGKTRSDSHIGIQGAFVDYHLRNVSANYDFDSVRVGIQPFTNDFRGFLFNDSPVGVRLFGTRSNNIFQYNLGWFRRLEKDTNSGLNDVDQSLRDDDIFVANLYWQDLFKKGLISQFSVLHNRNNEDAFYYDNNDFVARPASIGLEKPRSYQVTYLGYAVDGHIGRLNLSAQAYYAFGDESVGTFRDASTDIQAFFFAMEPSIDFDWFRLRSSFVYASGDNDPFDDKSTGFDAVFENPLIAGSDSSYWIRQAVPLIGGGRVALSGRNGILPSLRSSKEQGQANFANPGLRMAGLGFDADVLPTLRVSGNWNLLQFDDTTVLETARNQGGVDRTLGQDISLSAIYRPLNSQNIILRGSYSRLLPGDGFKSLFEDESPDYFLFNLVLTY
ncbi:hypothetical protein [Marinobacter salexigens]|uniref:Alginate export domain-containing protein n=1 Tax=Marinobacter salexigens TaxID=1925763 RepID=A0ABS6A7R2_9GAMM|nr:hypothetical protein [Marinobacter salexigens]MBU2874218.1 hypothetical protein [Marinobacter salexigens]